MPRPAKKPGDFSPVRIDPHKTPGGKWRARAEFWTIDGRKVQVSRVRSTKSAAREAVTELLVEFHAAAGVYSSRSTVSQALVLWIEEKQRGRVASNTLRRYREIARDYVEPRFGSRSISEVKTPELDRFLKEIADGTGRPTAKLCRTVLSGLFGVAVRQGLITVNPVNGCAPIVQNYEDPNVLDISQVARVRELIAEYERTSGDYFPLADLVDLLLATGCRPSEILALRWQDVDLNSGVIHINGTLAFTDTKPPKIYRQDHPKTERSRRSIKLPAHALDIFMQRRIRYVPNEFDAVFVLCNGNWIDHSILRKRLNKALAGTELAWVSPRVFRRVVATAVDSSQGTRAAAELLGHKGEEIIHRHYLKRKEMTPDVTETVTKFFT